MKVKSPCVAVCEYDPIAKLCAGCLRTSDEISLWRTMTDEQKQEVLIKIESRTL